MSAFGWMMFLQQMIQYGLMEIDYKAHYHLKVTEAGHEVLRGDREVRLVTPDTIKERQERTLRGAAILADRLTQDDVKNAGIAVRSGGTDVHLVLVDLREAEIDGKQAEDLLHDIHITVNRNAVPNDPRPPMVTSGLRIGTPALATRGFGDAEFTEVADIIALALIPGADVEALRTRVAALTAAFPLYPDLRQ